MDLGANETENRITLLLDYTKDHLYEIDNRLKMAYYKPVFYDAQYDQLIIRLRFSIYDKYTVERVLIIGSNTIDYYMLATDEYYLAKYVGEKLRAEIDYCSSLADMFERQSDKKIRLKT